VRGVSIGSLPRSSASGYEVPAPNNPSSRIYLTRHRSIGPLISGHSDQWTFTEANLIDQWTYSSVSCRVSRECPLPGSEACAGIVCLSSSARLEGNVFRAPARSWSCNRRRGWRATSHCCKMMPKRITGLCAKVLKLSALVALPACG